MTEDGLKYSLYMAILVSGVLILALFMPLYEHLRDLIRRLNHDE